MQNSNSESKYIFNNIKVHYMVGHMYENDNKITITK